MLISLLFSNEQSLIWLVVTSKPPVVPRRSLNGQTPVVLEAWQDRFAVSQRKKYIAA